MSRGPRMTDFSDNHYYSSSRDYPSYAGSQNGSPSLYTGRNRNVTPGKEHFQINNPGQSPKLGMYAPSHTSKNPSSLTKDASSANSKSSREGIIHLLNVYADKCSLNGVIFIKSTKYPVVKAIWAFLLMAAIGGMFYHLYRLGTSYYSFEKQSKLDLKFETLNFPAVTVCNVNAMRLSQRHLATSTLQELIQSVHPERLAEDVEKWQPEYEESMEDYSNQESSTESPTRKKRQTEEATNTTSTSTTRHRSSNYLDSYNFTNYDTTNFQNYESNERYSNSWERESEPAALDSLSEEFRNLYSKENTTTRVQMGHQIQDMLIQCSFGGRTCFQRNFTRTLTATYGNCYRLQYSKFVSRSAGPRHGLSLIFFLENYEHIPGITNSRGTQLVVHDPGTLAFPDDEGLAISGGTETSIGIRRVTISRLDDPYGNCTNIKPFADKYGVKYTRQTCQEICQMEKILQTCGCFDTTKPAVYSFFSNLQDGCQTSLELVECMEEVQWTFNENSTSCKCDSPCNEVQYTKTTSSKPWPTPSFANLLAKTICHEQNQLCNYKTMDKVELRENFVKINVFFETLNYETLSEEPDYTAFQFISDIGGTVGLYVGLSVLSMCEIFHLIIAICNHLCCKFTRT